GMLLQSTATIKSLDELAAECYDDPLGFVQMAYPWGQPGTFLADSDGPDTWQEDELGVLGEHVRRTDEPYRCAVASGHGIGKGAFAAMVLTWFNVTRPEPQGVVTANTQVQLTSKTWRELAKWHRVCLFRDTYQVTATKYFHRDYPDTWFVMAIPWNEQKAEAFQGTHEKHVMLVFDEASIIPPVIWETSEGALTQPNSFHFVFGNPTQNTGMFRSIFPGGLFAHRWRARQIDSRTCKMTDKQQLAEWEETYGADSDFFRIRVRGMFPKQSSDQLIGEDTVTQAAARLPLRSEHYPIIIGVDIARLGDDANTVYIRRGNEILFATEWREEKTPVITSRLSQLIKDWNPDAVFIDLGNVGAAIVDQLELLGHDVVGVNFGGQADKPLEYANKRTEMAVRTRDWLETTGSLMAPPGCERWIKELKAQLVLPKKDYEEKIQRLILESKKKMRKRGLSSPDHFDGLGLTFAYHAVKRNRAEELGRQLEAERHEPIERW
ncbi:MAG: terminase, partial [Gammaproteobacteria bacterium]